MIPDSLLARRTLDGSLNFSGTLDYYHNATGDSEDNDNTSHNSATVLVLAILSFLLVTLAIFCINLDKIRRESQENVASDGRTVASKEDDADDDDLEEGGTTADTDSDKGREAEVPVIVVVTPVTD